MAQRPDREIDAALAATAAEYVEEDKQAAHEETQAAIASAVFSVRLSPSTHDAVRAAAAQQNLTPSALIRQWVTQRVEQTGRGDLATAVAALRQDVERVADLVPRSRSVKNTSQSGA